MTSPPSLSHIKKLWIMNGILACTALFVTFPHQIWLLSISQNTAVKSFDGAIMPIAFVPDWKKSDYIERRYDLTYDEIVQEDLIPLPDYGDLKTDFNSMFTYITVFKGSYMDEERAVGAGSHDGVDIRATMQTPIFSIGHGMVTKVRDDDNNKYVVLEHRNVKYNGTVSTYYSSYLHLDSVAVNVGDIITKGTIIGKVGMSGITTTPHLHLQIDNEEAPFYPYWPFSLEDAGSANMTFFDGVSNGLNKDALDLYSVDPIHFIKKAGAVDGANIPPKNTPIIENTKEDIYAVEKKPEKSITITKKSKTIGTFDDISSGDKYYTAITYFAKKGLFKGFNDGTFKGQQTVTRAEVLGITFQALGIAHHGEILVGIFKDIPKNHWVNPLVSEAVKRKIVSTDRAFFEPNRAVTRVEFLAILGQASGKKLSEKVTKNWTDIDQKHWSQQYAEFALKYKLFENIQGDTFSPNQPVTRGEIAQAMYLYLKNTGKV